MSHAKISDHFVRPRRLRSQHRLRQWVAETHVRSSSLMQPYFVVGGQNIERPIPALEGVSQWSVDRLVKRVEADMSIGLRQVLLFGVLDDGDKDQTGKVAASADGPVQRATAALKRAFGADLLIATDVCLCGSLSHGHCGVLDGERVDNDTSLPPLAAMAVSHAAAGADVVAPSDMMDGRVAALRDALRTAGHEQTALMSYSVKYASAYYGPFRQAAQSAPASGDRKTYQMDPRNRREALREISLDEAEGADIVMVKPALAYLDVISDVRRHTHLPVACYNVSGEYALVKAGAKAGIIDEARVVTENLTSMVRAGADLLITYHASDALKYGWLTDI